MRVSVFGNMDLPMDAMPVVLIPELQKKFPEIEFVHQDPNEVEKPIENPWIIIDTVIGIPDVVLITDLSTISVKKRVSMHDYDLSMHLTLLKKIDPEQQILIIGIPPNIKKEAALNSISRLLTKQYLFKIK